MAEPQRPTSGRPDGEIIRPVDYRPAEETRGSRMPLSPLQLVLLVAVALVAGVLWFLFTAKSVRLDLTPAHAQASVSSGLRLQLGDVWLLRSGSYAVSASAAGYYPLTSTIEVGAARNQSHALSLTRLPGKVTFESDPPGATVTSGELLLGTTPTEPADVPAGPIALTFSKDRYQPQQLDADIEGMERPQTVVSELLPNWADVSVTTNPEGAEVFVDGEPTGQSTPAVVEILAGEHELRLKAPGHKSHRQRILVAAREQRTLPTVQLTRADSLLTVRSTPAGAGITLNGEFRGETPVELAVRSGVRYRLQAFRAGYASAERSIELDAGAERTIDLALQRLTGTVVVQARPDSAELFVNGRPLGSANQTLELPTEPQKVEIRLPGYAGYSTEITPREGLTQEIKVRLLTVEEARLAALKPVITTPVAQELVLLRPEPFTMGASRREPGRRANETLRQVDMKRLYYLARHEVTNAQYRKFIGDHDPGKFQDQDLDEPDQPVVQVSWQEAVAYCNWLSDLDSLPRFYQMDGAAVTGINPAATGYRLPTEAEWAWAARQTSITGEDARFPWGLNLPPPDRYGNYADRSAANLVGRIIFGYNDNHIVAAPVGTFPANALGLFDLSGNVAEWTNDFYEIPGPAPVSDPLGPASGEYHVIRGSSWMHGTITELRLSFRDYGNDGRQDLGFRIARFAEAQ
ncbi:MAG: PEGA domain-containing protein [Pseudomonadales bacterium]